MNSEIDGRDPLDILYVKIKIRETAETTRIRSYFHRPLFFLVSSVFHIVLMNRSKTATHKHTIQLRLTSRFDIIRSSSHHHIDVKYKPGIFIEQITI